jgi:uncharacterized protein YggU (UPF0235/DUF167 family)
VGSRVTVAAGQVRFRVRLTPKGGRDAIKGWSGIGADAFLKARVRAAPEDGNANTALIALLAKELGVAKSALAIAGGQKARLKTIVLTGDTTVLAARLNGWGVAK